MRVLIPQQILAGAWQLFFRHWREWFDLAVIPLIWSMLIGLLLRPDIASVLAMNPSDPVTAKAAMGQMGLMFVFAVVSVIIWSMFAAAWLRFCLGLAPAGNTPTGLSFHQPARAVAVAFFKLMLIITAVAMAMFAIMGAAALNLSVLSALSLMSMLASAPILVRLGMALPAAAMGADASLGAAWRLTRGNVLRTLFAVGVAAVATFFVVQLVQSVAWVSIEGMFGKELSLGPRLVLSLIGNLTGFAAHAFILATIALAYRQLGGGPGLQVVPSNAD